MRRLTKFYGLSHKAKEFLNNNNATKMLEYTGTWGLVFEPIKFSVYKIDKTDKLQGVNYFEECVYAEVKQKEVWNNGPMIFTCLINLCNPTEFLYTWSEEEINRK